MNRMIALVAVAGLASSALAGYTATIAPTVVNTPAGPNPGPDVGDAFTTQANGFFLSFLGDTPADLQLTGGDLNHYGFNLTGAVSSVNLLLGQVSYAGNYTIFYDIDLNGSADALVSGGTFTIDAQFDPTGVSAILTGMLTQTMPASNPAFGDLSYGGNPVIFTGAYVGTVPGQQGVIDGVLRQNAFIPAPGAAALLGLSGLVATRRRR